MFTGIIETLATLKSKTSKGSNCTFTFESSIANELKVDQSVAHNGVCLTVEEINGSTYSLTAIEETLKRTNLGDLEVGQKANIERCLAANGRFDGHIVQGHVDQTATCTQLINKDGSWEIHFEYDLQQGNITVQKGSICINGVSLTVVDSGDNNFSVAIIPYTWEHTNFHEFKIGTVVNLEFDILGKYIQKLLNRKQ
ncbi:riboflavin synthase alpha chain [Spirosomataceae bacterium TFI 002]|nr:riboflavin synthase alpha chain [Spirosomataceae bacterium TFI 002]